MGVPPIIKEILFVLLLVTGLYLTGWHTTVLGTLQRGLLWTGLFDPETEQIDSVNGPFLEERDWSFVLQTPQGDRLSLSDLRGNVIFLNVWASWCPPCVAEMPTIETLYEYVEGNEEIDVVLLSLDEDPEAAERFMTRRGFRAPWLLPVSRIPDPLRSPTIPSTYVISKEGQIIYQKEGMADYGSREFREWIVRQTDL